MKLIPNGATITAIMDPRNYIRTSIQTAIQTCKFEFDDTTGGQKASRPVRRQSASLRLMAVVK